MKLNRKVITIVAACICILFVPVVLYLLSLRTNYRDDSKELKPILEGYKLSQLENSKLSLDLNTLSSENSFQKKIFVQGEYSIVGMAINEELSTRLAGNCEMSSLQYYIVKGDKAALLDLNNLGAVATLQTKEDFMNFTKAYRSLYPNICSVNEFFAVNDYKYYPSDKECKPTETINLNSELKEENGIKTYNYYLENKNEPLTLIKAGFIFDKDSVLETELEEIYSCQN
jgi:hypothetical protein